VNSVAIAIDWSMRVKVRLRKSRSSSTGRTSRPRRRSAPCLDGLDRILPAAVSADSITASVPSSTALATSGHSARVGHRVWIIDSIICVAVMVSLLRSRASLIMRFCSPAPRRCRLRPRGRRARP
jgi:hypothetical protein